MTYSAVAAIQADPDFSLRVMGYVAVRNLSAPPEQRFNPSMWQNDHSWEMAAQPEFNAPYSDALAAGTERPGNDTSVVSDEMLASAVDAIIARELGIDTSPPVDPDPQPEAAPMVEEPQATAEPEAEPAP